MAEESVKVAVRVRPFNSREKDRRAKCIIKMQDNMTMIINPDNQSEGPKKFSFDYSYWSHDGFKENVDGTFDKLNASSSFASQRTVYDDLGKGVLDNAFEGYNCSLFAYGQTGSGKSYSMVGYGPNKGIVPIICDELFKAITSNSNANKRFEVTFSMLEIYNEQVRDLLAKDNPKGGLTVRQNSKLGMFYVESLKRVPVGSYNEIEKRMEQGTAARTVASTNMNATSSRAHTVVTITFDQIIKDSIGSETKKSSIVNLVDLAGSERADSTGATGDRLKEGANINRSLSALGNVISALADISMGKKKVYIPYRESVLTKLLQNALGGNSKTVMIAALSPADISYDETMSTLRYADRAKKIKNQAVINENPLDKLIRELKEENDRLKTKMEGGMTPTASEGMSQSEIAKMRAKMEEEIRAQLMQNNQLLLQNTQNWDEQLSQARTETDAIQVADNKEYSRRTREPHLINLNEDPMLSGVVYHFLEEGEITIGRKDATDPPSICLTGLSIQKQHAIIHNNKGTVEIESIGSHGSKTKVNGIPLTGLKTLSHKDRVLFGSNHLYVFMNPKKKNSSDDLPDKITWEYAQKEIAHAKGFDTGAEGLTKDQQIAQENILELLPMVSEVNAVSEEINKHKSFEVVLISAAARESINSAPKQSLVSVKMKDLVNGNVWLWDKGKFMNRRYLIQEMYQKYLDGENVSSIQKKDDPFWEPAEDTLIGSTNVFLQSLSYALDFDDKLAVTDYKGQEEGFLYVSVTPCAENGKLLDEDYFIEDPTELLHKPFHFKVTILNGDFYKSRFTKGIKARYRVYKEKNYTETKLIKGTLTPEFNHSRVITIPKMAKSHLDFFECGCITFLLYGTQEETGADAKLAKLTTKELRQMEYMENIANNSGRRGTVFCNDPVISTDQVSHFKTEMILLQRKYERLALKEQRLQQLCLEWSQKDNPEFQPFYRAVSAVANSSGNKLKTRVQLLNQVLQGQKMVKDKNGNKPIASENGTDKQTSAACCIQ